VPVGDALRAICVEAVADSKFEALHDQGLGRFVAACKDATQSGTQSDTVELEQL
jgi:hypothetical protein